MPEDPMDWIILLIIMGVMVAAMVLVFMMYSSGFI